MPTNASSINPPSNNPPAQQPSAKRVGRPSVCTPEILHLISNYIRLDGLSDSAAARRAGIGASTLSRWKVYSDDVDLVLGQAREEFRAFYLDIIKTARTRDGRPDWRAAAWLLERIFPEDYRRRAPSQKQQKSDQELDAWLEANPMPYEPERDQDPEYERFIAEREQSQLYAAYATYEAYLHHQRQTQAAASQGTAPVPVPTKAHGEAANPLRVSNTPQAHPHEASRNAVRPGGDHPHGEAAISLSVPFTKTPPDRSKITETPAPLSSFAPAQGTVASQPSSPTSPISPTAPSLQCSKITKTPLAVQLLPTQIHLPTFQNYQNPLIPKLAEPTPGLPS